MGSLQCGGCVSRGGSGGTRGREGGRGCVGVEVGVQARAGKFADNGAFFSSETETHKKQ
jgi:hypothetical protein